MPNAPEFVRNVMGSSAGAGSGEFHVYRHLRRKEYARQKFIQEKSEKVTIHIFTLRFYRSCTKDFCKFMTMFFFQEKLDDKYHEKLENNKKIADERTAKKRAKRLKKKKNAKNKGKKPKTDEKSGDNENSDSESDNSDNENDENEHSNTELQPADESNTNDKANKDENNTGDNKT